MAEARERRQKVHRSSLYADVIVELTQLTFQNLLPTVILTSVGLVGTTALLAAHYHDRWLWLAAVLMLLFAGFRAGVVVAFSRAKKVLTLRSAYIWQLTYAAATFGYCCAMALSTYYNFHKHDSTAWTLCTIGTFMICAGLSGRIGLHPRIVQASGLVLLVALALSILASPEPLAKLGLVLIALFGYTYYQSVQSKFEIMVEQMRSRRTLSLLADHDPLTGLSNRRHFEASLSTICLAETPFAILFIDLDRFKAVNDTYGHAAGDTLLQRVGVRLRGSVRRGDLVARIGGDEFAILQMANASPQAAESLARRINRAIATPFEIDGHEVRIVTSIGIRLSTPQDKDPQLLLSEADGALYRAKQAGGATFDFDVNHPPTAETA